MLKRNKIFFFLRVLIGGLLAVSGAEKILSPYQNFLYVIQSYEIVPVGLDVLVAHVMPWVELVVGLFLILGLWLIWALRTAVVLFLSFILIVGQALARNLPLSECGCFGELLHIPPYMVLIMDSVVMLILGALIVRLQETSCWSLDQWFQVDGSKKR